MLLTYTLLYKKKFKENISWLQTQNETNRHLEIVIYFGRFNDPQSI